MKRSSWLQTGAEREGMNDREGGRPGPEARRAAGAPPDELARGGHRPPLEMTDGSASPSPSRPSPPTVAPIVHKGVRYEQDRFYDSAGDQPGGYLAAIDTRTGARLWRLKVYAIAAQPEHAPVMARYFRSLRLAPEGDALVIESETGGTYRVDLGGRTSVPWSP